MPPQNLEALKKVADNVNIPIATGERLLTKFDFADLLPLHAVDLIQPDVVQAGGILELKKNCGHDGGLLRGVSTT